MIKELRTLRGDQNRQTLVTIPDGAFVVSTIIAYDTSKPETYVFTAEREGDTIVDCVDCFTELSDSRRFEDLDTSLKYHQELVIKYEAMNVNN